MCPRSRIVGRGRERAAWVRRVVWLAGFALLCGGAPDVAAQRETTTVAGAGAVTAADNKPQVETATAAGVGAVTAPDVGAFVATATVSGSGDFVDSQVLAAVDSATVAGAGAVAADDVLADVEAATVSAAGDISATDILTAATFDYVETGVVAGEGASTAPDILSLLEAGSVSGSGDEVGADVLGCIEAATAFGEAAVDALDVAVLAGFTFEETAIVAGEARIVWGDFLPFYAASVASSSPGATARGAAGAQSISGGNPDPTIRSGQTRGTARTEGN